jgi:hypothetical protein
MRGNPGATEPTESDRKGDHDEAVANRIAPDEPKPTEIAAAYS